MKYYYWLLTIIIFVLSCTKNKSEELVPVDPVNAPPSDFSINVDSVFSDRAEISWTESIDPESDVVKYDIWLNDQLIAVNIIQLKFSFRNLAELTSYSGKIIAHDSSRKQTIKTFSFTTEKYYLKFLKLYPYDRFISSLQPGGGEAKQILRMDDGSYIILGASYIDGAYVNGSHIFAMKIDYQGNEIWKKYYPYNVGPAYDVAAARSANSVLIAALHHVLKIDTDGNLIWAKNITGYEEIRGIAEDENGNIFIAGGQNSSSPPTIQEGVVTKLDRGGNPIWTKSFRPLVRGFFYDIQVTLSGELLVLGTRSDIKLDLEEQQDFWVLKLNNSGIEVWQRTYGDMRLDFAAKLLLKKNGNIVFVGTSWGVASDRLGRMVELSPEGDEIINLSYGYPLSMTLAVAETRDGGIITTGFADGNNSKSLQINKFNSSGMEEWNRLYNEMGTFLFGRSVLAEEDGGYRIVASEAGYVGYGRPAHVAVYKTDPSGRF